MATSYTEVLSGSSSPPDGEHLAAMQLTKGSPMTLCYRPTPKPGPGEVLIEVRAVALNPVDYFQRDFGIFPWPYPQVGGSDVAGVVVSAGSGVVASAPKPGTRVTAFASIYFHEGAADYGALQTLVVAHAEHVARIPDTMSFAQAALLPMSVTTAWCGWNTAGIPRDTKHSPSDKKGILVWGGAGSVGSGAVQSARLMGFTVYATASEKHHAYVKSLGASKVFDYKSAVVVEDIVQAAKEDGLSIDVAYHAVVPQLKEVLEVVKALKTADVGKVSAANVVDENSPKVEGVEATFLLPPADKETRLKLYRFVFQDWLAPKLQSGEYVPSPKLRIVEGGLGSADKALDELKGGMSSEKLVLEL